MRYFLFKGGTPYCGCDFEDVRALPDEVTEQELDALASEMAYENGETYSYCHTGWDEEFEDEEDEESYFGDCYCNWREMTEEEYAEWKKENE